MTAIPFVHIAPAFEVLENVTLWGARVYAIGSEIFTVSAILWCLNFMANMTKNVFVILLGQLTFEGVQVIYNNRREILATVNNIRNNVGSYFVYAS